MTSPRTLREHVSALDAFRDAYTAYLTTEGGDKGPVIELMPAAQEAFTLTGVNPHVADPPGLPSRMTYTGLVNIAFLDDNPGFAAMALSGQRVSDWVLEWTQQARARAVHQLEQEERRRKHPLYWLDRAFRGLLLIPAYVVGAIVGDSTAKIDGSAWGLPLRVLAVVADLLALYLAGGQFGVW